MIPTSEIHTRLHDTVDELERLSTLKSTSIEKVIAHKSRLDKASKTRDIELYRRAFGNAVKSIVKQDKLFSKVKTVAPNLAKKFEKINLASKDVKIDWQSDNYAQEFKALEKSDNKDHQMLAKLHQLLKNHKGKPKEAMIVTQLESLGLKVVRHQKSQDTLKSLAPTLTAKIKELALSKHRKKYKGQ